MSKFIKSNVRQSQSKFKTRFRSIQEEEEQQQQQQELVLIVRERSRRYPQQDIIIINDTSNATFPPTNGQSRRTNSNKPTSLARDGATSLARSPSLPGRPLHGGRLVEFRPTSRPDPKPIEPLQLALSSSIVALKLSGSLLLLLLVTSIDLIVGGRDPRYKRLPEEAERARTRPEDAQRSGSRALPA